MKSKSKSSSRGRRPTASEKLRIVLAGRDPTVEVSELCRREGLSPTQSYGWGKQLLSSASQVYDAKDRKPSREQERLETENSRRKDVICEITSENLELKKTLTG